MNQINCKCGVCEEHLVGVETIEEIVCPYCKDTIFPELIPNSELKRRVVFLDSIGVQKVYLDSTTKICIIEHEGNYTGLFWEDGKQFSKILVIGVDFDWTVEHKIGQRLTEFNDVFSMLKTIYPGLEQVTLKIKGKEHTIEEVQKKLRA